jgi:hypothetical protein
MRLNRISILEAILKRLQLLIPLLGGLEKEYLFSWDNVPGNDSEILLRFLRDYLTIGWAEKAEIRKSDDGKTIRIFKDENSAEIMIEEQKENATLKIRDGITLDLIIKREDGKLNIYERDVVKQLKEDIWDLLKENYNIDFKYRKIDLVELIGDQQKWQNIYQLASDIKSDARWRDVYVLDEIDEPVVEALIGVLETHPDADIRKRAIFLLGKIGDERAVKPLLEVLEENPDEASKAINEIGMKTFLKVLPEIDMKNRKWYFCVNKRAYI